MSQNRIDILRSQSLALQLGRFHAALILTDAAGYPEVQMAALDGEHRILLFQGAKARLKNGIVDDCILRWNENFAPYAGGTDAARYLADVDAFFQRHVAAPGILQVEHGTPSELEACAQKLADLSRTPIVIALESRPFEEMAGRARNLAAKALESSDPSRELVARILAVVLALHHKPLLYSLASDNAGCVYQVALSKTFTPETHLTAHGTLEACAALAAVVEASGILEGATASRLLSILG